MRRHRWNLNPRLIINHLLTTFGGGRHPDTGVREPTDADPLSDPEPAFGPEDLPPLTVDDEVWHGSCG